MFNSPPDSERLRIAIVHPTSWPQVRRGTERFMNELAGFLAARGHQITIVCSRPGRGELRREHGFVTEYHGSLWFPWMARLGVHQFHVFPLTTTRALLRQRFDVVHCFNFTDACAAAAVRRFTGARVLLHLAAIPAPSGYRRSISAGGALFSRAINASDAVITNGEVQAGHFEARFGSRPRIVKAPVDTGTFRPRGPKDPRRTIVLSASALEERRKGARFLVRSFNRLKERLPEAELHLCSRISPELQNELKGLLNPAWQSAVVFHDPDGQELAALYAGASVLVLPSVWEAFPLVILEALAAGTPVVGTRDGGIPELISNGAVGRTFDPGPLELAEPTNVDGLVEAIVEAVQLSRRPETAAECRKVAERFSWNVLGPEYEALYFELMKRKSSEIRTAQPA